MPFSQEDLKAQEALRTFMGFNKPNDLLEARRSGYQTAFLCFSHSDKPLALGLEYFLKELLGWKLYIDIRDNERPGVVDAETAEGIQDKICSTDFFLFLATKASTQESRWCPWEIGFADAKKRGSIIVVRTSLGVTTYGNEYLKLYKVMGPGEKGSGLPGEHGPVALWEPGLTRRRRLRDHLSGPARHLQLG